MKLQKKKLNWKDFVLLDCAWKEKKMQARKEKREIGTRNCCKNSLRWKKSRKKVLVFVPLFFFALSNVLHSFFVVRSYFCIHVIAFGSHIFRFSFYFAPFFGSFCFNTLLALQK